MFRQKDPVRKELQARAEHEAREQRRQRLASSPARASGVVDGIPVTLELRFVPVAVLRDYDFFSIVLIHKDEETVLKTFDDDDHLRVRNHLRGSHQRATAYFERLKVQCGLRE